MAYRPNYPKLPDPPYMPLDALERRLAPYLGPPDPNGCVPWLGAASDHDGILVVRTPEGSKCITAGRLVWALAGREWVSPPDQIRRTCGRRNYQHCCAIDHLIVSRMADRRQLTDQQVAEVRAFYWSQGDCRRGRLYKRRSAADAAQHAAWHLGISRDTVLRVVRGDRVLPHLWQTNGVDAERVRACHQDMVARHQAEGDQPAMVSQAELATRYGISLGSMTRVLTGTSYRHVPMPPTYKP